MIARSLAASSIAEEGEDSPLQVHQELAASKPLARFEGKAQKPKLTSQGFNAGITITSLHSLEKTGNLSERVYIASLATHDAG